MTDDPILLALGLVLIALGAVGATVTQRRFDEAGRRPLAVPALVPFGVLIGSGAAMVRGWNLVGSLLVGAVVVPAVSLVSLLLERRRRVRG